MGGIPLVAANPALRDAAGALFCWKTALLLGIVYLSIRVPRPFCRYLCPLGAVYGWFNPVSFYRLCVQEAACVGCGRCREVCPMDLPVWKQPTAQSASAAGAAWRSARFRPSSGKKSACILRRGMVRYRSHFTTLPCYHDSIIKQGKRDIGGDGDMNTEIRGLGRRRRRRSGCGVFMRATATGDTG